MPQLYVNEQTANRPPLRLSTFFESELVCAQTEVSTQGEASDELSSNTMQSRFASALAVRTIKLQYALLIRIYDRVLTYSLCRSGALRNRALSQWWPYTWTLTDDEGLPRARHHFAEAPASSQEQEQAAEARHVHVARVQQPEMSASQGHASLVGENVCTWWAYICGTWH